MKMCVEKQFSSSLKDSILIILPTSFFKLVEWDFGIATFQNKSMVVLRSFKR